MRSWPVGIGRDATPTPTGRFYITVKLRPPQISSVYGVWALGISGYSDGLEQFGTGDGQIALHGTDNLDDLGQKVGSRPRCSVRPTFRSSKWCTEGLRV